MCHWSKRALMDLAHKGKYKVSWGKRENKANGGIL
jgi:hypothetical protein